MAETQTQTVEPTQAGQDVKLIDCDVHAQPTEAMLAEHLGPRSRRLLERYGRRTPRITEWYPRAQRRDAGRRLAEQARPHLGLGPRDAAGSAARRVRRRLRDARGAHRPGRLRRSRLLRRAQRRRQRVAAADVA